MIQCTIKVLSNNSKIERKLQFAVPLSELNRINDDDDLIVAGW